MGPSLAALFSIVAWANGLAADSIKNIIAFVEDAASLTAEQIDKLKSDLRSSPFMAPVNQLSVEGETHFAQLVHSLPNPHGYLGWLADNADQVYVKLSSLVAPPPLSPTSKAESPSAPAPEAETETQETASES